MEEILASIRKIIEEGEEAMPRSQRESFEPTAIGPAANDAARPVASASSPPQAETAATAIEERREPVFEEPVLDEETAASLEAAAALAMPEPSARHDDLVIDDFEIDLDETEIASPEPATPAVRSTIISETPRRQVAASFGELAEALAASRQRSLEQIAEDTLRPMLQDWLDNNLPTLVEKLVREEIERVARGA